MIDNPHKLLTEVEDLERKLKDAQARLEAARAAEAELTEEQRLAVELHELTCTANHIDACGWDMNSQTASTTGEVQLTMTT